MRIAVLGRTQTLLSAAELLADLGHEVVVVATGKPSPEDRCSVNDFRTVAARWGATFLERVDLDRLRDAFTIRLPEIGVSVNYPVVLPSQITELPRLGVLNAHGGDLPRFRGNACQAWAILQGEDRVALCIHRMVGGEVDSGDIIARRYLQIDNATRIGQILQWMNSVTPACFVEAVAALEADSSFFLEQQSVDPSHSLRCFPRRPEDGRIDWSASAIEIVRLINASGSPYSGAFGFMASRRVVVVAAEIDLSVAPYLAVPGQVLKLGEEYVTIACGDGAIRITESHLEENGVPLRTVLRSVRDRLT